MHSHPKSNPSRPFLKWAGGKQRVLSQLLPLLPEGSRLIEPFLGAGSVFLGSSYPQAVIGDANDIWVQGPAENGPVPVIPLSNGIILVPYADSDALADRWATNPDEINRLERRSRSAVWTYTGRR